MKEFEETNKNTVLLKEVAKEQLEQAATISILSNKVDGLVQSMSRVLSIMENDDRTGDAGMVKTVRINSTDIDEIQSKLKETDTKIKTLISVGIFLSTVGTFLINFFWGK